MSKAKDRHRKTSLAKPRPRFLPAFTAANPEESRRFRRILLVVALVYAFTFSSVPIGDTDDQLMLTSAFSFVETGKFLAPSRFATKDFHGFRFGAATASGEVYSKYPPGYSFVLLLFLPLAGLAGKLFGVAAAEVILCLPSILALLATTIIIWRTALRLGYGAGTARLLALAFSLGSYAWGYVGTNYNEPYQALCAAAAFYCLAAAIQEPRYWRTYSLIGGSALGYGILLRPYFGILAPALVLGALFGWLRDLPFRQAFLRAALFAGPAVLVSAYLLAANLVLFGSATNFGYGQESFDTPFAEGFFGLLTGLRKGMFWFFPLSALVPWSAWKLWRSGKRWPVAVLAATAGSLILLIAKWWGYESGRAWGDRLILGVIPLIVLLCGGIAQSRLARKVAVGLVALGIFLNTAGVLINRMAYEKIAESARLPPGQHSLFNAQLPGHFWLLGLELTAPVLGSQEANPLWKRPPWSGSCPTCVPPPYRDAMNPILNPWPLRLFLSPERWTRQESGYMRGLLEIAIMRYEERSLARALELLDRGLALDPESPEFLAAKGMVVLALGNPGQALGMFDRALQSSPAYDLGLYGRGLCLEAMGNVAAAREAYLRLLAAPQGLLDKKEVEIRLKGLPQ